MQLARLIAAALLLTLAACGGDSGGGTAPVAASAPAPVTPPVPALTNFATLVVDDGPAALAVAPKGYVSDDIAFVSVTLCVPGTSTCQTIDHVVVDTGSIGLRIPAAVLDAGLLAALPQEKDTAANPVGECYGFVDGYAFGSVRQADFQIDGEAVAGMAIHVVGDSGRFAGVPAACSAGGGRSLTSVKDLGGNGILGIGVTATDCSTRCTVAGGSGAAGYYDCPASGCTTLITRAALTTAPFEQLPNPVAAMAVDNNGVVISLPAIPADGTRTLTGTLYFGIGTQTNNGLGAATVLTTSTSTMSGGAGLFTIVYKAASLTNSFIDSGSNSYFFADSTIAPCTDSNLLGYYCPPSPVTLTPVIQGRNGVSASPVLTLYNAKPLLLGNNAAVPGIGADPSVTASFMPFPRSFDLGLPFFFGRTVYVAIEGRNAGGTTGPYFAF